MRSMILRAFVLSTAAVLAACGGSYKGGGSSTSSTATTGGTTTTTTTTPSGIAGTLTLTVSPASIIADGSSTATLTAKLLDTTGQPIVGAALAFATNGVGSVAAVTSSTDSTGTMVGRLTSGKSAGRATVTVKDPTSGLTVSVDVGLVAGPAKNVFLSAAPGSVQPGGSVSIDVYVVDQNNNLVSGEPVNLGNTANPGSGGTFANALLTTDQAGHATTTYVAGTNLVTDQLVAVLTNGNASPAAPVQVSTAAAKIGGVALTLGGATAAADGTSATQLRAVVTDTVGNPMPGQTVIFSATAGTVTQGATTDATGTTIGNLTSPTKIGNATVRASVGGFSSSQSITFVSGKPAAPAVTLAPSTVGPGGTTTVALTVKDANGNAVANEVVSLSSNGTGTFANVSVTTDANGRTSTTYTAGSPATLPATDTLTATLDGTAATTTTASLTINATASSIGGITLQLGSSSPVADGTTQTAARAVVTDTTGAPMSSGNVSFTTTAGGIPASGPIANGVAQVMLTSPSTIGSATVTAATGGFSASQNITFVAGKAVAPTVTLAPTSVAPGGNTTVSVVVVDAKGNPVSNQAVNLSVTSNGTVGTLANVSLTTDGNGRTSTTYTAGSGTTAVTDTITATLASGASNFANLSVAPAAAVQSINLVPNTTSLPSNADGTSGGAAGVTLTAIVLDTNNNAVPNATVAFAACLPNGGTCPGTASTRSGSPAAAIVGAAPTTDSNGVAQATLTTGGNPTLGTVNVTASSNGFTHTITINVVSPTASSGGTTAATANFLTVAASSSQLAADASTPSSGVTITAFVADANRNAVAGVPVTFASSSGQIVVGNGTSDPNGQASATLTTGGDSSPRCITITVNAPQTSSGTLQAKLDCTATPSTGIAVSSTTSGAPVPAALSLLASSPQLSSNGSQSTNGVTLTALVKDSNNNVIPGINVSFSTPNSAAITVTRNQTDPNGTAAALLTTGGDPQNRVVNVTATTSNGVSKTTTITVVGTTLTVAGPTSAQSGVAANYTATLLDSGGAPIANTDVTFSYLTGTATLSPSSPISTNSSGQATVSVTPTAGATGTVQAVALGLTATQSVAVSTDCFAVSSTNSSVALGASQPISVSWKTGGCSGTPIADGTTVNFSTTRGSFTAPSATTTGGTATLNVSASQSGFATITATSPTGSKPTASLQIEFVATAPKSVSVQASPATIDTNQQSTISAVVLDANNNLVKNATVQFTLTDTTGGTLSTGSVVTNSQGKAQVVYSASSTASSANGVKISASVTSVTLPDGSTSSVSGVSGSGTLTVGGAALHITLGTGNNLTSEGTTGGNTTYVMPWVIVVRDSAGNPAQNAQVSLSVQPVSYGKGCSEVNNTTKFWVRTDCAGNSPISCTSEDLLTGNPNYDGNGIVDPGEDLNGDGILQPGGVAEVPQTVTLDSNGIGNFQIRYPMDHAYWVTVRLRATATVSGTESINQVYFDLPGIAGDFSSSSTPPGIISPYGFLQDCAHEPLVSFSKLAQGAANGTTATANIALSVPAGLNPITLPFTVGGTGVQGTDFTVTSPSSCTTSSCSVTIPAGGSASKIDVSVTGSAKTAKFTLGTPSSQAVLGYPSTHTVALDGAAVSFDVASETIAAGSSTTIGVSLDRVLAAGITVAYSCVPTPGASTITVSPASPLTIAAGSVSTSLTITSNNTGASAADMSGYCQLGAITGPGVLGTTYTNSFSLPK